MKKIFARAVRSLLKMFRYSVVKRRDIIPEVLLSPLKHERDSLEYDNIWSHKRFVKKYLDKERLKFYQAIRDLIKSQAYIHKFTSVVDVGCGPGYLLKIVAELNPEARLVGLDFSNEVLQAASEICPSAMFQKHDIYEKLGETFDLAVCSEVLEHLDYPHKALDQLTKIANCIVLTVPNGRKDSYAGHINFWSMRSWEVFLEPYTKQWKHETCFICGEKKIATIMRKRVLQGSEF